jgi:putative ABC transport system ATP-binding protein
MLVVEHLVKTYGGADGTVRVLDGVSLSVAGGDSVALVGESGSGKSTLLHLVAGLDTADSGRIAVAGTDVGRLDDAGRARMRRERIGLVFQQFNLVPSLTVEGNLSLQARLAGRHDPDLVAGLARRLGLDGLMRRYPEALSGGQQQRVAIGRALAARPDLILADEPTGSLDEATGDSVMDLLASLVAEQGAALIVATHSGRLAARLGRILRLKAGHLTVAPA